MQCDKNLFQQYLNCELFIFFIQLFSWLAEQHDFRVTLKWQGCEIWTRFCHSLKKYTFPHNIFFDKKNNFCERLSLKEYKRDSSWVVVEPKPGIPCPRSSNFSSVDNLCTVHCALCSMMWWFMLFQYHMSPNWKVPVLRDNSFSRSFFCPMPTFSNDLYVVVGSYLANNSNKRLSNWFVPEVLDIESSVWSLDPPRSDVKNWIYVSEDEKGHGMQ